MIQKPINDRWYSENNKTWKTFITGKYGQLKEVKWIFFKIYQTLKQTDMISPEIYE